jgi:hypothetical protein
VSESVTSCATGPGGLLAGTQVELVGIEDQSDGGLRLYLTHRSRGEYVVVDDPDVQRAVRATWAGGGRVLIPAPPATAIHRERP